MDFVNGVTLCCSCQPKNILYISIGFTERERVKEIFRKHSNPTHRIDCKAKGNRFFLCLFISWCCCMRNLFFSYCFGIVPLSVFYRFTNTRTHIERYEFVSRCRFIRLCIRNCILSVDFCVIETTENMNRAYSTQREKIVCMNSASRTKGTNEKKSFFRSYRS